MFLFMITDNSIVCVYKQYYFSYTFIVMITSDINVVKDLNIYIKHSSFSIYFRVLVCFFYFFSETLRNVSRLY